MNNIFNNPNSSMGSRIRSMLVITLVPLALLCAFLLFTFIKYSNDYDKIIESLTIASEFSYDFQKDVDYNMYQYVVGNVEVDNWASVEEIQKAKNISARLKTTTIDRENLKRLESVNQSLDKLEKNIITLQSLEGYDEKMDWLDKRIRMLTGSVKENMQTYIYYETTSLALVREKTSDEINKVSLSFGIAFVFLVTVLTVMAMKISKSIAKPVQDLSENIRAVGEGNFTLRPISPGSNEVQTLSETFEAMVERMSVLMDNIRLEQDNLRMAEFRLLQAQINPHFLYNTLDTVIWLAEDKQNEKLIDLITSLSLFFRTSLSNGKDIITIGEEILHIKSYLEIQQIRYQDILSYEIDVDNGLNNYSIPKLTLQPLVENALYHGIKNKRSLGKIIIKGRESDGKITFIVNDNGIGMKSDRLENLLSTLNNRVKDSFGLSNVFERLQLYYRSDFNFYISSEYGKGSTVSIELPMKNIEHNS